MHPPARNLAWLARHHFGTLRLLSFLMCLGPSLWLGGEWLSQSLGVNPLNRLLHFTGRTALIMLTITLAVTPASPDLSRVPHWMTARRCFEGWHADWGDCFVVYGLARS